MAVPRYSAYFIDHAGNIFSREYFEASDDERAVFYARVVFQSGIGKGFEVWQGDRHLHTEIFR